MNARTFDNWNARIDAQIEAGETRERIRADLRERAGRPAYPGADGVTVNEFTSAAGRLWFLREFEIAAARYPLYHDRTR